jgi:hypothetical protein
VDQEHDSRTHWQFLLDPPSSYNEPPGSAILEAKRKIADFLRGNPQKILGQKLIGVVACTSRLPECDLASAVFQLARESLLEVRPPADWDPSTNPYGSGGFQDGKGGYIFQVELPFEKAVVAPTNALWTWRRENDLATLAEGTPVAANRPDSVPAVLSPKDLTRMLSALLGKEITEGAVESFLRRHRENSPDCFITVDDDDRRRNQPKYLYRTADVLPVLKDHFRATDGMQV